MEIDSNSDSSASLKRPRDKDAPDGLSKHLKASAKASAKPGTKRKRKCLSVS
jgi:hypothetical protein